VCVLVEGHCISDTVALQEMIATPAAKLPYDHHQVVSLLQAEHRVRLVGWRRGVAC